MERVYGDFDEIINLASYLSWERCEDIDDDWDDEYYGLDEFWETFK